MEPNYIRNGFKTRESAVQHILECILQSPNCAGADGKCRILAFGTWLDLKPGKKK